MATSIPVHEIQLGPVNASISRHPTQFGADYEVRFRSVYRAGKELIRSDWFWRRDLLSLAKVVNLTHTWIERQRREEAAARKRSKG